MPLRLIQAPAFLPVSLDLAKGYLRVDHDEDDVVIGACLETTTAQLDGEAGDLGRALVTQGWALDLDRFPGAGFCPPHWRHRPETIEIPLPPLQSIDSVKYYDASDVQQTLNPAAYIVHLGEGLVEPALGTCWAQTSRRRRAVTIEFTAGYGDATEAAGAPDVPANIRQAILLMTGDLYENREGQVLSTAQLLENRVVQRLLRNARFLRSPDPTSQPNP